MHWNWTWNVSPANPQHRKQPRPGEAACPHPLSCTASLMPPQHYPSLLNPAPPFPECSGVSTPRTTFHSSSPSQLLHPPCPSHQPCLLLPPTPQQVAEELPLYCPGEGWDPVEKPCCSGPGALFLLLELLVQLSHFSKFYIHGWNAHP